ncbi:MAG: ATP-binding cassette domain-containing protein [Firmicutes bacterium]|nr:ATP-binding cassette domain-containing protein [Bacillota bacterium]
MNNNNQEPLLKVEHLSMYFGKGEYAKKAVNDVSFDVKKGEVFGLVGESGCGKTTTGRTIIRLYDATSGNVYFKGKRIVAGIQGYKDEIKKLKKEISAMSKSGESSDKIEAAKARIEELQKEMQAAKFDHEKHNDEYRKEELERLKNEYEAAIVNATEEEKAALTKKYNHERNAAKNAKLVTKIQMIYQDPVASLDPRMTVREIIAEGLKIQGIKDEDYINEQVYKMLETVGLVAEHASRYPHEFSGGQRQRIGIARSIIMNPEMIIADEPISALDVSIRAQVINLLNELRETRGLTILFIAHDLSVVKYFSDRIGVMYFGNMVELATSDELFAHPLHPYTRSLLSAVPLPDPISEKRRVRIRYNPLTDHEHTDEEPEFREIVPGHFVRCTLKEFDYYREHYDTAAEEAKAARTMSAEEAAVAGVGAGADAAVEEKHE